MTIRVHETRVIDAPVEVVAAVLLDVGSWPQWTDTFSAVRRERSGPLRVGERVRVRQPRLPVSHFEVTEADPTSFSWQSRSGGVRTFATHAVSSVDGSTTLDLGFAQTGALAGVVGVALGRLVADYVRREADNLKRFTERQHAG